MYKQAVLSTLQESGSYLCQSVICQGQYIDIGRSRYTFYIIGVAAIKTLSKPTSRIYGPTVHLLNVMSYLVKGVGEIGRQIARTYHCDIHSLSVLGYQLSTYRS